MTTDNDTLCRPKALFSATVTVKW